MADSSPAPAAPPATPPKPTGVVVSKAVAIVHAVVLIAAIGVGGFAIYQHVIDRDPTPPAPGPGPEPDPTPQPVPPPTPPPPPAPEISPVAKVTGLFFPLVSPGVKGTPDAPLGLIRASAEQSTSSKPIRWKVKGPADLKLSIFSPDGALAGSIAEAYPTVPGTYKLHAIARGKTKGEPDADIDSYEVEVGAPKPPDPGPGPGPNPPVPPNPPQPDKPAPIPGPGPHILMIFSEKDWPKTDPDIRLAMLDQSFRDACTKAVGAGNWMVLAAEADISNLPPIWQDAMKRPHPEMPWIIVSDGKSAAGSYEGKFPGNAQYATELVQKLIPAK